MVSSYEFILQQIGIYNNDYAQISLTDYKTVLYGVAQNFPACCWGRGKWLMSKLSIWESPWIELLTNTAAISNLLDLSSIMGCPGGHSLSIYARFSGKKRTSMYISRQKGDHHYIQTRHNDLFFSLQLFLGKLREKSARKANVNTDASISDRAHAAWASYNTP